MKSGAFHFSPKIHRSFGLLLIEILSPKTIKKPPNLVTLTASYKLRYNWLQFTQFKLILLSSILNLYQRTCVPGEPCEPGLPG